MTTLTPEKFKELVLEGQLPKVPITVNGDLDLQGCTGLTAIGNNLTVNGYLDLRNCAGLKALPENFTVKGSLYLNGCKALKALPNNLTVNGNLYLRNCTGLTALPDNLTVNGSLDLWNCTGLKSFYTAKVSGDILFEVSLIARIPHEELIKHLGLSPEIDALIAKRFKSGHD